MKKKKILLIVISIIIICSIGVLTYKKFYNRIPNNWVLKIEPVYLDEPSNALYLYKNNRYIITNEYTVGFGNIVRNRGKLSYNVNYNEIVNNIKQDEIKINIKKENNELNKPSPMYSVTLEDGTRINISYSNTILELIKLIEYEKIFYN